MRVNVNLVAMIATVAFANNSLSGGKVMPCLRN